MAKSKKTAKQYAQEQLGKLDLSYLDNERNVAQNTYNTSSSSLESNFNNLLNQIESNRADTRKNFNTGRATVAEQSYNANRTNQADLASRGVGSSGLKGLGEVGNRIETGRQYSNLANEFYNSMNELKTTEDQGRTQYDIDKQIIKNTLDQALAGIDTRRGEAQNNYNMTLGQLAEQVQGRWDANDNAAKALQQAKDAALQAHNDALQTQKDNYANYARTQLTNIKNSPVGDLQKIAMIAEQFNVPREVATHVLTNLYANAGNYYTGRLASYDDNVDYVERIAGKYYG